MTIKETIVSEEREVDEEQYIEEPEEQLEEEVLEEVEPEEDDSQKEVVERAKKYGHLSREEWEAQGRDPKLYKSAEEFDKTGKVIEQLYTLKKKVDQRDREIQALVDYQQRTAQREFERAKKEIESRLAESKNDMDMEGVAHYTKELVRLQDSENATQVQTAQQIQRQAQEAFIERNEHWFNDRNPDLKERAIEIDNEIKESINRGDMPPTSLEAISRMIEKRMQYEHPERVLNQPRASRPSMPSGNSSVNKTAVNKSSVNRTFQGLSQDLKDTYSATKRIVESRGDKEYTINDFINQLKKDGEI